MNFNQKAVIHNRFDVEVRDAKTGELKQTAVAYNIILDRWFHYLTQTGGVDKFLDSLRAIAVGDGTGTLDVTRSGLFRDLVTKTATTVETVYAYPVSYITKEIRIQATELNGKTLTEVGFKGGYYNTYYYLMTHAFLKDSEGNQIAITKTDTDVVIIRGTFYVTFNRTGFGENGLYPPADQNRVVKWLLGEDVFPATISFSRYLLNDLTEFYRKRHGTKSTNMVGCTRDATAWRIDYPITTWLDTEKINHTVRTIGLENIGAISLPDHTFFPPMDVTKIPIGTGDGVTTEFNIKAPFIIPNSEIIFVNNVALTKGVDYEIEYENNFCDMHENYHTAGLSCQMDNVSFGNFKAAVKNGAVNLRDPIAWWDCSGAYLCPTSCAVNEDTPIFFDFGTEKRCNRMKIEINTVPAAQINNLKIQYSEDNISWSDVPDMTRTNQVWSFTLTSARYWRVFIPAYNWSYAITSSQSLRDEQTLGTTFFLGITVPGLKFTTPPASGAAIEASYQIELPFKTANNLLRFTCSLLLSRGEGS